MTGVQTCALPIFLKLIGLDSCQKCGYKGGNNACLDFHHVDKNKKTFSFANYFSKPSSIDKNLIDTEAKILEEAKRCIVLCRNCHAIEHLSYSNFENLKDYIYHKVDNYVGKNEIDKNIIIKMHLEGKSGSEIARTLNLNKTTVCKVLTRNGYKPSGEPGLITYWRKYREQNNIR